MLKNGRLKDLKKISISLIMTPNANLMMNWCMITIEMNEKLISTVHTFIYKSRKVI